MHAKPSPQDLTRSVLAILFTVGLLGTSLWILKPFLPALIWATTIAVATWSPMLYLERVLWGRRALAVFVMTLALLLVFVIPFSMAIGTLLTHLDEIVNWGQSLRTLSVPGPPGWLERVPMVGGKLSAGWQQFAESGPEELARYAAPYAKVTATWFLAQLGSLGAMTGQFLLTVLIAAVLYATGETAVADVRRFARRLAGARGDQVVDLAGQAIRGVALGIVVVAIGQAALGGIGLALAGVPFPVLLTAVMFLGGVIQIGVVPVMASAVGWLYWQGSHGWATALLVWTIVVGTIDNVVRPVLIKRGAKLPLLLIVAGVLGGLVAFGLVGIFVGPVVLGVNYMLFEAWVREENEGEPIPREGPAG